MPVVFKQTIKEPGRAGKFIDDFYYRDMVLPEGKTGTGMRAVSTRYIVMGKMLDRFLMLHKGGDVLEVISIFATQKDLIEWRKEPEHRMAEEFFEQRHMEITTELYYIDDYMSLDKRMRQKRTEPAGTFSFRESP